MPTQIGKYELLEEIGHGGMATVYRGRDSRLDRLVAVKVMHPHLRKTPEARARFTREAKSVARLRHRNILEIYDNSTEDSEDAFIVTELLTGPTLKAFREGVAEMPAEVAAAFAVEIALALQAAHEAGVIHRDVKPENVLLHNDECLKLTDFGIAQMVDAQSFTATGQILGSPGHMAPEQIEGGDCDARSDVFALGTVLYYLATGRLPFEGRNAHQVLRRVVDGDCVEPLRLSPRMGAGLSEIIQKAMKQDPADRFQDAGAMAKALCSWLQEQGVEDPSVLIGQYMADPRGVSERVTSKSLERALALANTAIRARDSRLALCHLNRALSLDEGNNEALAALRRLNGDSHRRSLLWAAGVSMALLGSAAIGWAAFGLPSKDDSNVRSPRPELPPDIISGRALGDAVEPVDVSSPNRVEPVISETGESARAANHGPLDRLANARVTTGAVRQLERVAEETGGSERKVCFAPSPMNVTLAVDGEGPVSFNRASRCRTLRAGLHRVRVLGAEGCCEPLTRQFQVLQGTGEQLVPLQLVFKASRLYVNLRADGEVPPNGSVTLDQGLRGGTREFLEVPMASFRRRHSYRVEVPGYEPYQGVVELVAGSQVQATVALQKAPETALNP